MTNRPDAYWTVEQPDPEQPPRLVWWHPEQLDCAVIDVDDVMFSIEDRVGYEVDLAGLSEQAITELCHIVTRANRSAS